MKTLTKKAYGKINLALDVLSRRADGYHDIAMIMQAIDLYDIITITLREDNIISINSNVDYIPLNEDNIVYKVILSLQAYSGITTGVDVFIEKNIPMEAGLAGGSADGATTLLMLNELWKLNLNMEQCIDIAKPIGADIPFCLLGGVAIAEGIGEQLTTIKSNFNCFLLIVKPGMGISTKLVYESLILNNIKKHPDIKSMVKYIEAGDIVNIAHDMVNVLEVVTIPICREIEIIKQGLIEHGALNSMMSGSGTAVFGIFETEETAIKAYEYMKTKYTEVFLTKTKK